MADWLIAITSLRVLRLCAVLQMTAASVCVLVATALAVLAVSTVSAQCCMYCPNGVGVSDQFSVAAPLKSKSNQQLKAGAAGSCVMQISTTFYVPDVPNTLNASLTSTLFSGVVSVWNSNPGDTYIPQIQVGVDESGVLGGGWFAQAVLLKNGNPIASGAIVSAAPGSQVVGQIEMPTGLGPSFIWVTVSAMGGLSTVNYGSLPSGRPDSSIWNVGWGWGGVSGGGVDCSVVSRCSFHVSRLTQCTSVHCNRTGDSLFCCLLFV